MEMTLDMVAQDIKTRLIEGGKMRKSAFHTLVVGTSDIDLRVMVLREFDPVTGTLRFHTDLRSPKVAAVTNDPQMTVLAYDSEAKVQIRMRGKGRVESSGPIADKAWSEATNFAKRCYLAEAPPSSPSDGPVSGLPDWIEGITPEDAQVAAARENFAVLLVSVREFDWLYLANTGHRRAKIVVRSSSGDGASAATQWLVP
ncbi:flavin-binding protein [Altererythrobacter gangjinensis]|uniref:Flavin-binding protein n=2 Tax=Pontixanthobacter gangjinensis TaxID=1028742 RepID=A0A6I4SR85_9SPHN|nr:flavin-binding protein [Pontixanthobacter gangjinensis]